MKGNLSEHELVCETMEEPCSVCEELVRRDEKENHDCIETLKHAWKRLKADLEEDEIEMAGLKDQNKELQDKL